MQGFECGDGRINGVTIVGATPPIEQAVFVLGRPGAQVFAPTIELGLFVEMTVQQHGVRGQRAAGRPFKKDHWRAAFKTHNL